MSKKTKEQFRQDVINYHLNINSTPPKFVDYHDTIGVITKENARVYLLGIAKFTKSKVRSDEDGRYLLRILCDLLCPRSIVVDKHGNTKEATEITFSEN